MILAALALFASTAFAEPAALSYGLEADGVSRYVFRGLAFSEGPAFQPSAWACLGGGTLAVWTHFPLTADDGGFDLGEVDPSFDWAFEFGDFGLDVGAVGYIVPGDAWTAEGLVNLSYAVGWASIFLEQAVDVKDAPGSWYAELGVSSEHEAGAVILAPRLAVAFADAAYNDYYVEPGVDWSTVALERGVLGLDVAWYPDFAAGAYLRAHGEASVLIDATVRDRVADPFQVVGGLALGWEGGGGDEGE
jgi:hypothetical protein